MRDNCLQMCGSEPLGILNGRSVVFEAALSANNLNHAVRSVRFRKRSKLMRRMNEVASHGLFSFCFRYIYCFVFETCKVYLRGLEQRRKEVVYFLATILFGSSLALPRKKTLLHYKLLSYVDD